jgi:hypothetical protein
MTAPPESPRDLGPLAMLFVLGGEMAVPAVIGTWLDGVFGLRPWLTVGGAVLGFLVVCVHGYALLNRPTPPRQPGPPS